MKLYIALYSIFLGWFTFHIAVALSPANSPIVLTAKLATPERAIQVFYKSDVNAEYDFADVLTLNELADSPGYYRTTIPAVSLDQIRIDPSTAPASIAVESLCVKRVKPPETSYCWDAPALQRDFWPRRDITTYNANERVLSIQAVGPDAFFESRPELAEFFRALSYGAPITPWVLAILATMLASILLTLEQRHRPSLAEPRSDRLSVGSCRYHAGFAIFVLIISSCFLIATSNVSRLTPPLQGADELEHLGKLLSYDLNVECGVIPARVVELWTRVKSLAHHPERKWNFEQMGYRDEPINSSAQTRIDNGMCRYSSFYVALPALINSLRNVDFRNTATAEYLSQSRQSVSIAALILFLLAATILFYGRPLWLRLSRDSSVVRCAGLLTLLYMMFLPQTIWLSATLSQDYLLLAMGYLLAVSVFFRIPVLSDLLLIGALVVGGSKGVYLIPFSFLFLAHYLAVLSVMRVKENKLLQASPRTVLLSLGALFSFTLIGYVLLRFGLGAYCKHNYCYGLERSGLVRNLGVLADDLSAMFLEHKVLLLPDRFHHLSSFGDFGWLDAPMPSYLAQTYVTPIMAVLSIGLLSALCSVGFRRELFYEGMSTMLLIIMMAAYWLLSLLTVYLIFYVMMDWCGDGSPFGCAYQRRYELPLYSSLVYLFFIVGLRGLESGFTSADRIKHFRIIFAMILASQIAVCVASYRAQLRVLDDRYHFVQAEL